MITTEEYLAAKAIVDEYERIKYEHEARLADESLDDDYEDFDEDECEYCRQVNYHSRDCVYREDIDDW